MVSLIVVILLCSAMSDWARAKDWESREYNEELRHEEIMHELKEMHKDLKSKRKSEPFINRRRAIKDSNGRVLVEEVLVNSLEDLI